MDVQQLLGQARDALTVKRVFGEPYEKDGLTVLPAAMVMGGGGGGSGQDPGGAGKGEGGGFGMRARPVGVFVIRGDDVTWRPAVDATRLILGAQVVALVAVLSLRSIVRTRARARR
jgi:uncharacterized spore protein YtfJ